MFDNWWVFCVFGPLTSTSLGMKIEYQVPFTNSRTESEWELIVWSMRTLTSLHPVSYECHRYKVTPLSHPTSSDRQKKTPNAKETETTTERAAPQLLSSFLPRWCQHLPASHIKGAKSQFFSWKQCTLKYIQTVEKYKFWLYVEDKLWYRKKSLDANQLATAHLVIPLGTSGGDSGSRQVPPDAVSWCTDILLPIFGLKV